MKLILALLTLLFADMATAFSGALADHGSRRSPASGNPSLPREFTVIAQADEIDDDGTSYQQTLEAFLNSDDFVAAKDFVDALSENTGIAPATLRSLNDQIRRIRTARLIEYAEKIRKAIASSDLETVKDYSERMQRLTTGEPGSNPVLTDDVGTRRSGDTPDQVESARKNQPSSDAEATQESKTDSIAADAELVRQMRTALDEDRLFPPIAGNAFDLAVARLALTPDDAEAHGVITEAISKQQSEVLASLESGRPEIALILTGQLLEAVEDPGTEAALPSDYRSSASRWVEGVRPDIIAGLIAGTEKAIEQLNLTVAPQGKMSAEGYVDLMATELGQEHEDVALLAGKIIASYQGMIDQRLAKRQYDAALTLHARMESIAERFGVSTDQIAALKTYIEALPARQQRHDQLLLLAAQWRDKGQLIEPAGANALEFAARAVRLAVNPAAADKVVNDVILEQRQRIDRLIDAGRLEEAASQLQQLGSAIEQIGTKQIEKATEYYAEAEQVLQRADLENEQRIKDAAEQDEPSAAAVPNEPSQAKKSPFTFVSPF